MSNHVLVLILQCQGLLAADVNKCIRLTQCLAGIILVKMNVDLTRINIKALAIISG